MQPRLTKELKELLTLPPGETSTRSLPMETDPIKPTETHSIGAGLIAISEIKRDGRMRKLTPAVNRHIEELMVSIAEHGVIQPIVITDDKRLIAGGCRTEACDRLGLTQIPFVYRESVPDHVLKALELEENLRREDMHWHDYVLGVYETHQLKIHTAALDAQSWGVTQTGKLLGVTHGYVSNCNKVAEALLAQDQDVINAGGIKDALRILSQKKADAAIKERLRRSGGKPAGAREVIEPPKKRAAGSTFSVGSDLMPNIPEPKSVTTVDQQLPTKRMDVPTKNVQKLEIPLSEQIKHMDCHDWFKTVKEGSVDIVYTDIPYGIDMENLEGIANLDLVAGQHDVDENVEQMPKFLEGAFKILKDNSYCVFWYALDHHEKLINWAEQVGFTAQRWPIVWIKQHPCKNSAAHCNFTKATEYAMVLRKGTAHLREAAPVNYIIAEGLTEKRAQSNPFAKPFKVSKFILDKIGYEGQIVADPYAGQGSLLRAALNLGFVPIGCEKMEQHYGRLVDGMKQTYRSLTRSELTFS